MFSSPYLPSLRKIIKFYVRASKCTYHSRFHLGNPCFLHLKIPERKGFVVLFWELLKPPLISRGGANDRGTLFPGRGKTLKESDFPPFFPPGWVGGIFFENNFSCLTHEGNVFALPQKHFANYVVFVCRFSSRYRIKTRVFLSIPAQPTKNHENPTQ